MKLPAGKYTFSFWAKGSEPGVVAYITVNKQDSSWPVALQNRADGVIRLTTDWKRYSHTFTADGNARYSAYYGIADKPAWFDRFMINAGEKPLDWVPTTEQTISVQLPEADGNVYPIGTRIPVTVLLKSFTGKPLSGEIKARIVDYSGKELARHKKVIQLDKTGKDTLSFSIPENRSGWFQIIASAPGAEEQYQTLVVTRPPEPTIPEVEPFLGLCHAETFPAAAKLIGIKWLQQYLAWYMMEEVKGKYNYSAFDKMREYKKQGFKIQVLVPPGAPQWIQPKKVLEDAAKLNTHYARLLPPADKLEVEWRTFIRKFLEQHRDIVDIYELGAEMDALIGLNTYYKSLDTKNMIGPFTAGESLDRSCRQMEIAAEEIFKQVPSARVSAVRPSDVDSRYAYAYSKEFMKRMGGKNVNCFGIDCYPQPRWIGPGQPATGTEQDLATRYQDAKAALKACGNGSDVYIAEYGYFVDFNEVNNVRYLQEQLNRLARSYLKAKLVGMKSLHWFATNSTGLEGKRYHMGIWWRGMPLPAVGALNGVGRVIDNVKECVELPFHENMGVGVFHKVDGRAAAALWSTKPEFQPAVLFDADKILVTDVMGNPVECPVENGKIRLTLSEIPYYLWLTEKGGKNYAKLKAILEQLKIEEDLPVELAIRPESKNQLKLYMKNTSRTKDHSGIVEFNCDGKKGKTERFTIGKTKTEIIRVPLPAPGKKIAMTLRFEGDYKPYECEYVTPNLISVPRVEGIRVDGKLDSWKKITPVGIGGRDHIHPVDHTTYDDEEDLSAKLYLAHDGTHLYFAADVTDDKHFQGFPLSRIWRGDCIQIGIDPKTNFIRNQNDLDPDDTTFTLGLLKNGPGLSVHRAPAKSELSRTAEYKVTRNEAAKRTLYQIKLPLALLDDGLKKDSVFGFNCIVMDDDTGSGADYWLFLKQGLAGGLRPDKWAQCILE